MCSLEIKEGGKKVDENSHTQLANFAKSELLPWARLENGVISPKTPNIHTHCFLLGKWRDFLQQKTESSTPCQARESLAPGPNLDGNPPAGISATGQIQMAYLQVHGNVGMCRTGFKSQIFVDMALEKKCVHVTTFQYPQHYHLLPYGKQEAVPPGRLALGLT